jgi:hypothetical protein
LDRIRADIKKSPDAAGRTWQDLNGHFDSGLANLSPILDEERIGSVKASIENCYGTETTEA